MAALTKERNTPNAKTDYEIVMPVKASTKIYNGAAVCSSAGYAVPAADTASLLTMGVAYETADNSAVAVDGAISVPVRVGCFFFDTTAIVAADVGKLCYWTDDHTVDLVGVTAQDIVAGKIMAVDATFGVLVDLRQKVA